MERLNHISETLWIVATILRIVVSACVGTWYQLSSASINSSLAPLEGNEAT